MFMAVSTSIVPAPTVTDSPIPHLLVSLDKSDVISRKAAFTNLWNAAGEYIIEFSENMQECDDLGKGVLLDKWAEIGKSRLLLGHTQSI
jgi:hypothetical protein